MAGCRPGLYTVMAEILVNGNAMNSEIEHIPVVIGREPLKLEALSRISQLGLVAT